MTREQARIEVNAELEMLADPTHVSEAICALEQFCIDERIKLRAAESKLAQVEAEREELKKSHLSAIEEAKREAWWKALAAANFDVEEIKSGKLACDRFILEALAAYLAQDKQEGKPPCACCDRPATGYSPGRDAMTCEEHRLP